MFIVCGGGTTVCSIKLGAHLGTAGLRGANVILRTFGAQSMIFSSRKVFSTAGWSDQARPGYLARCRCV